MPNRTYASAYRSPEEPPPPNDPKGYRGPPREDRPPQTALLVTGSRDWPPDQRQHMQAYVRRVLHHAQDQDMRLLVADDTQGVNGATIEGCAALGLACDVYGTTPQPQHPAVAAGDNTRYVVLQREVPLDNAPDEGPAHRRGIKPFTPAERDQRLVNAADRVLVVWNGVEPGSQALHAYAQSQDKAADLVAPQEGRMRLVREPDDPPPTSPTPAASPTSPDQAEGPDTTPVPVYTLGYASYEAAEVTEIVERLDATLVDVRLSGRSRKAGFSKGQLTKALGDRYLHLPEFGNENYNNRAAGVQLRDYAAGLDKLRTAGADQERSLILMCGCKNAHTCHRSVVAAHLADDGFDWRGEVADLDLTPDDPAPDADAALDDSLSAQAQQLLAAWHQHHADTMLDDNLQAQLDAVAELLQAEDLDDQQLARPVFALTETLLEAHANESSFALHEDVGNLSALLNSQTATLVANLPPEGLAVTTPTSPWSHYDAAVVVNERQVPAPTLGPSTDTTVTAYDLGILDVYAAPSGEIAARYLPLGAFVNREAAEHQATQLDRAAADVQQLPRLGEAYLVEHFPDDPTKHFWGRATPTAWETYREGVLETPYPLPETPPAFADHTITGALLRPDDLLAYDEPGVEFKLQAYVVAQEMDFQSAGPPLAYELHGLERPWAARLPDFPLQLVKQWHDQDYQRHRAVQTVGIYPTEAAMQAVAEDLTTTLESDGLGAMIREAETLAGANGYLDPTREDPRLFPAGPPDPFTTRREAELEEAALRASVSEAEPRVDVPHIDLEADETYADFLTGLHEESIAHLETTVGRLPGGLADLLAFNAGSAAWWATDLLADSSQLSGVEPHELAPQLAQTLAFQALPLDSLGLAPLDEHDPSLAIPPYYDPAADTALWIGVVKNIEAGTDACSTCVLAVQEASHPTAQAYLTPCFTGDLDHAYRVGQQLVDALTQEPDLTHFFGVAEGLARAHQVHPFWQERQGLALDDSISDALSRHLAQAPELER